MRGKFCVGGVLVAGLTACTGHAATPVDSSAATATTVSAIPTTGGPSGLGPGREVCRIEADGGAYYLALTSVTDFDLSECNLGTPEQGWLDHLFDTVKGFDKRCNYDPVTNPTIHALVGVYSSSIDADENAALGQCLAHKATYQ